MNPITERQGAILNVLRVSGSASATHVQKLLKDVSIATIKRDLAALVARGFVESTGRGRGAGYRPTALGTFFAPIDAHAYCAQEPDERDGSERYDDRLFDALPATLFMPEELARFDTATAQYRERNAEMSETIAQKETERFVIELSWKSSRIEGNTYTLLDTERLIREGVEAPGHTHDEAVMILNHKAAFAFASAHRAEFAGEPSRAAIEELHRLLTTGLGVPHGTRRAAVGIVGTRYRPLDNEFQIREAMQSLSAVIMRASDPYSAACIALIGVSYVQPFEDGNKRTARLLANAILLARGCAPLSYRSTDEAAYREATLVFYETHSLVAFKSLFAEQYLFAAEQYGVR